MPKPVVVLGLYGTTMDRALARDRWSRWRPTVSLFQREDLAIARLELVVPPGHRPQADEMVADVRALSPETTVVIHELGFTDPWDFEEVYEKLHDLARRLDVDPDDEELWVHLTTGTHTAQICLFLLTEAGFLPGRLVQVGPPTEREPGCHLQIIDLDLARYDRLASRFAARAQEATAFLKSGIETRNVAFNRLIDRIERVVVASRAPLLLTGPTGAGKSQLARQIYALKKERRQLTGGLVEVNCATLRGDEARSALFGHKKGAFTGATADRPGLLVGAHQGLLFLDEIGELGLDEQAMLLKAVEEGRFLPVGGDREASSDFQLIAGTNRDLRTAVTAGRFREDLLARIDLWAFRLPGLAERREDIAPNLDYELEQLTRRTGRRVTFNREARERFLAFGTAPEATWDGNFRDLNAAVTRMATLAAGGRISVEDVDDEIARLRASWRRQAPDPVEELLGDVALDRFDRVQLGDVIDVCRRSRSLSEAGRALFAVSRTQKSSSNDADRLRKYLHRFGLQFEDLVRP